MFSLGIYYHDLPFLPFSHLEEDPLYIAYADMMAKVRIKAVIKLENDNLAIVFKLSTCQ